jgi:hypothetical protein
MREKEVVENILQQYNATTRHSIQKRDDATRLLPPTRSKAYRREEEVALCLGVVGSTADGNSKHLWIGCF